MLVYLCENLQNNKKYVGITSRTLEERKEDHFVCAKRNNTNSILHKAIRKYGPDSFVWKQIDTANTVDELYEKEKQWIKHYDSKNTGYNLTDGGEGTLGLEFSDERIEKQRQAMKKALQDNPEIKKKIAESVKKTMTEEHRALLSEKQKEYLKTHQHQTTGKKWIKDRVGVEKQI